MSYEYKRWKKDKSSIIPIEETYTNDDVNNNDENIAENGYRFNTPRRWCTDNSKSKSIGIRDLHLKAPNCNFWCKFLIKIKAVAPIYDVTWNTDHYDIDRTNPDTTTDVVENNMYISDWVEIRATPDNNFEEVFYSLINDRLNDFVWKEVYSSSSGYRLRPAVISSYRGDLWVKSTVTDKDGNIVEDDDSAVEEASFKNIHPSPIPTSIRYRYDGKTGKLSTYVEGLSSILVKTNPKERFRIIDVKNVDLSSANCKDIDIIENATEEISDVTYCYDHPRLYQASLLMLIDSENADDVVNCYSFFNQPIEKNADGAMINTVTITIDDEEYLVPFINKDSDDGTNMTLRKGNEAFNCHFTLTSGTDNNITSVPVDEDDDIDGDVDLHTNLDLENVWDRVNLYYHASFADNRHKIIGRNGDHWDTPNKRFTVDGGAEDNFRLWFTTDGLHRILPTGCIFNVDLTFMLNSTKNIATGIYPGNHDSFK